MTEDKAVVHYVAAGLGRSFYTTICGLNDDSNWVTLNKNSVTCAECRERITPKSK